MTNWPTKKLGKACEFIFGCSFPAKQFNQGGRGLPVIKTGNIKNNSCEYFYDGDYDKKYLVKPDDILIGLSGTIISGQWRGKPALLNQRVVKLNNFSSDTAKNFAFYVLPIALKNLERSLWKAAVKNILKQHLESLKIPSPPLPIQQKIVEILDSVQNAVGVQEKLIEKLKELKKAMMAKLFREGIRGAKSKKTKIGEIPEDWGVVEINDVVLKTEQNDPSKNPKQKIKYIDVSGVSNKSLKIIDYKSYLGEAAPSRARKILKKNDIIFATVRPYLKRIACVGQEFDGFYGSTAFCVLRSANTKINPHYLFNYISTDSFVFRVSEYQKGSGYPAITDADIKNQLIPLPHLSEQHEIAGILETIDQRIEIEQKKKALYEELFRAMLNGIMSQKINVEKI